MFLELFIGLITALFIWDYVNKRRRNKIYEENGFKAVPALPIIGSIHHFLNVTPETVFEDFSSKCYQYGRTYYLWEFGEASIFTIDVELIEAVLSNNQIITKNSDYELLNDWIGGGLLLSSGKKWHQHRKILTPTFHFKILEQFVEVFDRQFRKMIEKFKETADGKTVVDVYPKFCLTALDIITETAMGVSVNAQEKPEFPYAKAVSTAADIILKRSITPGLRYDFIMRLVAPTEFKALNESIKITHDFGNKVIKERREALEKSIAEESTKAVDDDQNDVGTKKRMAFLDLLLQANIDGKPLTNEEIRQEVDTFMFAGHDTTTTATSHILYLLSRHPEVQQKLFEEIYSVFGNDKEREIKMHDLNELRYMECVIKEGLRIHAPASTIGRYTDEDIVLKNGTLIPAKTNVGILIYHVLKDPLNFPESEAFKPERFEASSDVKINPFAYIPFSAGPRNCIGQKFAMLEIKTALSLILMNFELLPLGEKVRPFMSIVTRSANGCQMGFKPRNY